MEFGLLGPIAAWSDGRSLPVGGPRQRCVLGVLLVHVGREVTFDQLIGYLWSDDPPRTARSVIQVQISHLRRAFPEMIRTTSGGYLADIEPDQVDLHRFRRLRSEAEREPPEKAVENLSAALGYWRGIPFSGVGSEHLYYSLVSPLLEERWNAVAEWADHALFLGRAREVVSYLTPIARAEPMRERIHQLLITALWHSGERAKALATYEELRSHLSEELGVDPGPDLGALHARILRSDRPSDTPPQGVSPVMSQTSEAPFVVRNDLPRDIPDFSGRSDSFAQLLDLSVVDDKRAKICVITGSGGVGKTTIAVRAGHELADHYADGQLFIDLYGYAVNKDPLDPSSALGALLRAIGASPEEIPEELDERSALWRARLMGKRLLLVLDNAVSYAQVSPLLTSSPGSLTLITSRNDLSGLSGAKHLNLGVLEEDSSLELFAQILGEDRVEAEPEEATEVVRLCGGLPLALRVIGARMLSRPRWTFAHVVRRLSDQSRQFQELRVDGQSVESVIDLSYRSLTPDLHTAFLLLSGSFGRSVDLHGAAALMGLPPEDADDLLQELVGVCLLDEPHADVYRFHDLIHAFATQRARNDIGSIEYERAREAHAEYFTETTDRAAEFLGRSVADDGRPRTSRYEAPLSSREEAEEWFELHQEDITEVVEYFATRGRGDEAWRIADSAWKFYAIRGRTGLLLSLHERALAANDGSGHERGRAVTLIGMGIAYYIEGSFDRALEMLTDARDSLEAVGDEWGMVRALSNLAMVYERVGRFREAAAMIEELLDHDLTLADPNVAAVQWGNLAVLRQMLGEHEEALRCAESALRIGEGASEEEGRAYVKRVMGEARAGLGDLRGGFADLNESLEISLRLRLVSTQIYAYNSLGVVHRNAGELDEAVLAHEKALELAEESGDRSGDAEILVELGATLAVDHRLDEAVRTLEKAWGIAAERNERYMAARAELCLGLLPESVMKVDRGRALLTNALGTFEELDLPEAEQAREALRKLDG